MGIKIAFSLPMTIHYPKSFFKLLSVGFLLAVLPLIIGLLTNTVAIQRLATQSQRAIYDAARVTHAAREISGLVLLVPILAVFLSLVSLCAQPLWLAYPIPHLSTLW